MKKCQYMAVRQSLNVVLVSYKYTNKISIWFINVCIKGSSTIKLTGFIISLILFQLLIIFSRYTSVRVCTCYIRGSIIKDMPCSP